MPLYEYKCSKCGRRTEKIENLSGPYLKKCPKCGGKLERTITAPAIQFKGSGWYVTEYGGKSAGSDSSKAEKAETAAAKPGEPKGAKESKESKESKDTAPAKETKKAVTSKKDK